MNFNKNLGEIGIITGLFAAELSETGSSSFSDRLYGYNDQFGTYQPNIDYYNQYPLYDNLGSTSGTIPQGSSTNNGPFNRSVSVLGNFSYIYKNRYTIYGSARRDGSNVFGVNTNNRWKPLWSAGASWDIDKESFYNLSWLPALKLRTSIGYMGNVNNSLSGLPTIVYSGTSYFTKLTQAQVGNAANPNLRWEQVRILNVGIDYNILKGRITGSIDVFNKRSTDLISGVPFDPTTGILFYNVNSASLKGNGFELAINSINTTGSVRWETGLSVSYAKMVVSKIYNGGYRASDFISYALQPAVGRVAYGLSSYKWGGLDPLTGDPQGYLNGKISKDYVSIFNDSVQNQVFHGSSQPLYTGYLRNSISWKHFTLSANITFRFDYYFRKTSIDYNSLFGRWSGSADYYARWQKPGDEKHTNIPSLLYPVPFEVSQRDVFYAGSAVNVLRGDNIRLQDARLEYLFDKNTFSKFPFTNIVLFVYANNLNTILWRHAKSPFDPDFAGGSDANGAPTPKTYTIGAVINIK